MIARCISLERRQDRWNKFCLNAPDQLYVQRFKAVDGMTSNVPKWWKDSRGAWGCFQSHLLLLKEVAEIARTDGLIHDLMVLEDDAVFCDNFHAKFTEFMREVPDDWGVLYLGGQHLETPVRVSKSVYEVLKAMRTHAYMVRSSTVPYLANFLDSDYPAQHPNAYDVLLDEFCCAGQVPTYCPVPWLVGQAGGPSDIEDTTRITPEFWDLSQAQQSKQSGFSEMEGWNV